MMAGKCVRRLLDIVCQQESGLETHCDRATFRLIGVRMLGGVELDAV